MISVQLGVCYASVLRSLVVFPERVCNIVSYFNTSGLVLVLGFFLNYSFLVVFVFNIALVTSFCRW